MLPASNRGAGMNLGFPDVCATPPMGVPIPYPNMAMNAMAVPFSITTYFSFVNALNMGSTMPMTLGDNAGTMSPFMGPGTYTMGHPLVIIEGLPGINLLCPTTGNNMINGLGAVMVPSVTNVFFTHAAAPPQGEISALAISELARALSPAGGEAEAMVSGGIATLSVPVFSSGIIARLRASIERLREGGLEALVLDLRGNPGGDLMSAIALAGDFLDEGALLATVIDADGDETVYRVQHEPLYSFPLVLLVNQRTASAAEVFAGCLQVHGRAVVVGERTHGKGSAQRLLPGFAAPGARYLTVASIALPNGELIEGRGVHPDVTIERSRSPADEERPLPETA